MKLGPRQLLRGIAVVLFVIAVFSDVNYADLIAWGLAAFAASFLVDELGLGGKRR